MRVAQPSWCSRVDSPHRRGAANRRHGFPVDVPLHSPFSLEPTLEKVLRLATVHGKGKVVEIVRRLADSAPDALVGNPLRIGQVLTKAMELSAPENEGGFPAIGSSELV